MTLTDSQLTALRIAIAEDQGVCTHAKTHWVDGGSESSDYEVCDKCFASEIMGGKLDRLHNIPNYPADRNAIVEAIVGRFTKDKQIDQFTDALCQVIPVPFHSTLHAVATASAQTLSLAYAKAANLNPPSPEGK